MRKPLVTLACLGIGAVTGVAAADPDQLGVAYVENPYATHDTSGSTLRLGTSVGYLHGASQSVHLIGATLAGGHRFGRLQLEAEFGVAELDTQGVVDTAVGAQQRLGVIARYDVIRLGAHAMGPNSMLALYVEGGADRVWTQWDAGTTGGAGGVEGQAGFGLLLEHRLQEPITIPRRVGWFLGWRMGYTPESMASTPVCRGTCAMPTLTSSGVTERETMFQSSLQITW